MLNMKTLGLDVGSLTTKAVILSDNGILTSTIIMSGDEAEESARMAMEKALSQAGISINDDLYICLLYTSPSPRDLSTSRMPSSA